MSHDDRSQDPAAPASLAGLDPHGLLANAAARGATPLSAMAPLFPAYELLDVLGAGGSGTVYRARHRRLQREVAIKVLHPEVAQDRRFIERFEREALAATRLQHPFLIHVHDFGEVDGVWFVVLEHCTGGTLRGLLRGDATARAGALRVLAQVCEAVDYLHRQGAVHRDLKPENVLLDGDGHPRVADFGLMRLPIPGTPELTATGDVLGTPHYMAPEQLAGQPADARADVYSLGVMLYEALTGALPVGRFVAPSAAGAMRTDLDAPVMAALSADPAERPTIGALRDALLAAAPAPATRRASAPERAQPAAVLLQQRTLLTALALVGLTLPWVRMTGTPFGSMTIAGWSAELTIAGLTTPMWLIALLTVGDLGRAWWERRRSALPSLRWLPWLSAGLGVACGVMLCLVLFAPIRTSADAWMVVESRHLGFGLFVSMFAFGGLGVVSWRERVRPPSRGRRRRRR